MIKLEISVAVVKRMDRTKRGCFARVTMVKRFSIMKTMFGSSS